MLVIRFSDSRACKADTSRRRGGGDARRGSSSRFRKLALYLCLISCVELERLNNGRMDGDGLRWGRRYSFETFDKQ